MTRCFVLIGRRKAKFWEVTVQANQVAVRFGQVGMRGRTLTKTLADPDGARRHAQQLIGEKTNSGYVEARFGQ